MQHRNHLVTSVVIAAVVLLIVGCQQATPTPTLPAPGGAGIANPAATYCAALGYKYDIRDEAGGQNGYCTMPDKTECMEWDFLAGRCGAQFSFCAAHGGTLTVTENSNVGTCTFSDGSSCPKFEFSQGT